MNYWLMKSEPATFGIDDLARAPRQTAGWDGVRNYQARNMLRDDFRVGDRAFFHHSSCEVPGIVGTMEVVRAGHPDPTAFDRAHRHFDVGSDPSNPRWYQVEVRLLRKFAQPVTLETLREHATGPLRDLIVLRRGNRLSVMPVTADEWKFIHRLARERPA
jgi:predicted RNA-binding protein with PUA-like domain